MNNYKMLVQYDGTRYNGWQKQGDTDNTIQQKLENILGIMTGEPVDVHGAGRTDAGVHAKGQVAQFRIETDKTPDEIKPLLNGFAGRGYTVDARKISVDALGRYFPNSPMLAAAVAVSAVMEKDDFIREMRASYEHKFAKKPEVIDGNMKALTETFAALEPQLGM